MKTWRKHGEKHGFPVGPSRRRWWKHHTKVVLSIQAQRASERSVGQTRPWFQCSKLKLDDFNIFYSIYVYTYIYIYIYIVIYLYTYLVS